MNYIFPLLLLFTIQIHPFTLMLDPAGDARTPGRTINQHMERGITLQIAEAIKKEIEQHISSDPYEADYSQPKPWRRVVLTRVPGESIAPLHNAVFANRLDADLYISIHCFHATGSQAPVSIYHYLANPVTDLWSTPKGLALYPYDQAHLYQVHRSKSAAEKLKGFLAGSKIGDVRGVYGFPFKPLVGIKVPAVAIEIGLRNKDEWARYAKAIADSVLELIPSLGS